MSANWGDNEGLDTRGAPAIPSPSTTGSTQSPPGSSAAGPKKYQRLKLAKRTVKNSTDSTTSSNKSRSSIFGAAKPREQVLKEKGIDVKAVERKLDERIQRLPRMNQQQQEEFNAMEQLLASAKKKAAAEDTSVDEKAEAEAEVAKLTQSRAEFLEARKKEEIEYARKRREEQRAEEAAAAPPHNASGHQQRRHQSPGTFGQRDNHNNRAGYGYQDQNRPVRSGGFGNRDGGRQGGFSDRDGGRFGGLKNSNNRGMDRGQSSGGFNSSGGDFSNFGSNRDRRNQYNRDNRGDNAAFRSFNNDRPKFGSQSAGDVALTTPKLFVGQLDYSTTDTSLRDAFSAFGNLEECTVIMNRTTGQSKGFGFVTFRDVSSAQRALAALNGAQVDGRTIVVKTAQP